MSAGKNAIFLTVRTGSTRLPDKALLTIQGKSTIEHLIEHIRPAKQADIIVLCTTTRPEDKVLVELADRSGILHFRGSEPDKLARWLGAAKAHNVEFFVTADGDDLFTDPELIDQAFERYRSTGCDFIHAEGYPCGAFTYGIATRALEKVCQIKNTEDTEMMWGYFLETGLFRVEKMNAPIDLRRPEIRMTLDYPEDLSFFTTVIHALKRPYSLRTILTYLNENPMTIELNQFRQAEFLANQKRKAKVVLKAS